MRLGLSGAFLMLLSGIILNAQTFRGGIAGNILDPAGSSVAEAAVGASSAATRLKRQTVTSATGEFSFQDLPLGQYLVTVSQPGFAILKIQQDSVEVSKENHHPRESRSGHSATDRRGRGQHGPAGYRNGHIEPGHSRQGRSGSAIEARDFTQLIKLAPGVNGAGLLNRTCTT